jgi:nitroreductase
MASRIDFCPMEGFNPAGVNEALGLEANGLSAVCMLALGYRDATIHQVLIANFLSFVENFKQKLNHLSTRWFSFLDHQLLT